MADEFIKIFTKEQLQQMDKDFLVERNLLLEDQLKIYIEREEKFNKHLKLVHEMLVLDHSSLAALLGKYQFELEAEDPELTQRLVNNSIRFEEIRQYIVENHCINDDGVFSDTCYFKSEWMDGGQPNEENL